MKKVCYFTSKPPDDPRIFYKECKSLANAGYEVYLVSPNAKPEISFGVNIVGIKYNAKSLFSRLFVLPKLLYKSSLAINADIYHFNDPASLYYGIKLKKKGKKVIFVRFEDHPLLLLEHKGPYFLLKLIGFFYKYYEAYACKHFDALIFCYHWTQDRLSRYCKINDLIFNFPILQETPLRELKKNDEDKFTVCYAGLLSQMWNIDKIFSSLQLLKDVNLKIAGHGDNSIVVKYKISNSWVNVNFYGRIAREDVYKVVYSRSDVGMALLDYLPLCKFTLGNLSNNKLFEYLMFGLPVICTNFYYWKEVVEKNNCGICVNPNNVNEIVDAIMYLKDNPEIAQIMGENGKRAVKEKYNWSLEESKLLNIYEKLSRTE